MSAEVEYLSAQLWQLPLMQQALDESEASGHTCGEHCSGEGHHEAAQQGPRGAPPGSGGSGFSDSEEQQRLALMLNQLR